MHHNFIIISRELFVRTLLSCHLDFIEIATTYILRLLLQYKIMKPIIQQKYIIQNHFSFILFDFSSPIHLNTFWISCEVFWKFLMMMFGDLINDKKGFVPVCRISSHIYLAGKYWTRQSRHTIYLVTKSISMFGMIILPHIVSQMIMSILYPKQKYNWYNSE